MIFFWGIGAGFGGFVGCISSIFQLSLSACAVAGIGWPLVLPRLLAASTTDEENQIKTKEE